MNTHNISIPGTLKTIDATYYHELIRQVEKDFNLIGLEVDWNEETPPLKFWQLLLVTLQKLLEKDPEKLRALLYRIDLDESLLSQLALSETSLLEKMAQEVLIRELKKINMRHGSNWE